ncbi:MAG: hypothetical protein KTR29_14495 [Rhodothermaceae bacterium]|nr:hypothetical protein [Rhodothermaceae bacterium]
MDTLLEPLPSPSDLQSKEPATKKKSVFKKILGAIFIGALLGVSMSIGFFIGDVVITPVDLGLSGLQKGILLTGIFVLLPFAIAIHEGGHLLGGKLAGFQFALFVVGPLMIMRQGNGIKFKLNKSFATYGGLAASFPTSTVHLRRGMLMLVAGGPLTSLLTGLLFFALGLFVFPIPASTESLSFLGLFARIALLFMGLVSIVIAFVTMIPGKTGGFMTDGARLRLLAKGGPASDRELAVWQVTTTSMAGTRPSEWPKEALESAITLQDESIFEYVSRTLFYTHAMDAKDYRQARQHLLRALSLWNKIPASLQPSIAMEAAYFESVARQDAERARTWLDEAGQSPFIDQTTKHRSEAAVLITEGKYEEAREKLEEAEKALNTILDAGMAKAQENWVQDLHASTKNKV